MLTDIIFFVKIPSFTKKIHTNLSVHISCFGQINSLLKLSMDIKTSHFSLDNKAVNLI